MDRTEKQAEVTALQDRFGKMTSAVFTDFRRLNVDVINRLRRAFEKVPGIEYRVIKNTLVKLAVKGEAYSGALDEHLVGPTAIAWSYDDPVASVKVAVDFAKENENFKIKCAVVDGAVLDRAGVTQLSKMPGKDALRAQLLATFMAPASGLVRLFSAAPTNFVYLLEARKRALGA